MSLSEFNSLDFILTLKKEVLTKLFHIDRSPIEILYLILVSFKLGFKKFQVEDYTK